MLNYQKIVDDVRSSLSFSNGDGADFMRSAAADYMVACEEINERLRRCGQLLRQGLRSEALQSAETEPVLLDIVATLDFPERPQWIDGIRRHGIVPPPELLLDVAADLNEAYALEQPLSALLSRHRLLALCRAALPLRIDVLRQLAELDPQNGVWREDLAEYERERWKQIHKEIGEAAGRLNAVRVLQLRDELTKNNWLEMPPKTLLDWADKLGSQCTRQSARVTLEKLEPELNEAFAALDLAQGRRLGDEWYAAAQQAELSSDDPLVELAAPALEWLANDQLRRSREDTHLAAIAKLESALDSAHLRLDELEALHHAVSRNGFPVPSALENRVRSRTEALQLHALRRFRALSVIGLVIASGLAIAAWYGAHHFKYRRDIAAQVSAFTALLNDQKIHEAETFYSRLKESEPGIAIEPEIEELQVRLASLVQEENSRSESFQDAIRAALADGPANPMMDALNRAGTLAKTTKERTQLAQAKDKIETAHQTTLREREEAFGNLLRSLRGELATVEKLGLPDDLAAHRAKLESISARASDLKLQQSSISRELAIQLNPLIARLAVLERDVRQESTRRQRLTQLNRTVGDRTKFAEALTKYSEEFADTGRGVDFRRAAGESHLWETVQKWNDLLTDWNKAVSSNLTPNAASVLVEQAKRFQNTFPNWPGCKLLEQKLPYLKAIAGRAGAGQPLQDSLIQLFNDDLVTNLWMVELSDGSRYYLRQTPPEPNNGSLMFRYISDFKLTEKGRGVQLEAIAKRGVAPQSRIAEQVHNRFKQLNDDNWEETFVRVIKLLCEPPKDGESELDVLLQLRLLQQTVQVACDGSHVLQELLAAERKALSNSKVNPLANWLDPQDKTVANERIQARREKEAFAIALSRLDQAAAKLRQYRSPLVPHLDWSGWLEQESSDHWRCSGGSPQPGARLFVVYQASDGRPVIETVGSAQAEGTRITSTSSNALIEGRPVFAVSPSATAKTN